MLKYQLITKQMILDEMLMKCDLKDGFLSMAENKKARLLELDFRTKAHGVRFSMPEEALTMSLNSLDRWLLPAVAAYQFQVSKD